MASQLSQAIPQSHIEKNGTRTLKSLASLNKEVRPFFLGDNTISSLPSVSSLSDYSIWRSLGLF